jgi:hypothetical protein
MRNASNTLSPRPPGTGKDVSSASLASSVSPFAAVCVALHLFDDLASPHLPEYKDAQNFKAFCPLSVLPALVLVSPAGAILLKLQGPDSLGHGAVQQMIEACDEFVALFADKTPLVFSTSSAEQGVGLEDPVKCHFKFTDGSVHEAEFLGATTLGEVFRHIDNIRRSAPGKHSLTLFSWRSPKLPFFCFAAFTHRPPKPAHGALINIATVWVPQLQNCRRQGTLHPVAAAPPSAVWPRRGGTDAFAAGHRIQGCAIGSTI